MKQRIAALREGLSRNGHEAFVSFAPPTNQYISGFTGTTSAVIITATHAQFLCDFRYTEQAGRQVSGYDIEQMTGSLVTRAGERLKSLGARSAAFEPQYMTCQQHSALREAFPGDVRPDAELVAALRRIKSREEIDAIRAALRLAEGVLADALHRLQPGVTERDVAAWFEYEFKRRGASGASFDTIALFGARTSLPHGAPGDRVLKHGDPVLIDFGCRLDGYCSDLTRSYAFATIPAAWYEEIYALTLSAQQRALDGIRPGMSGREADALAREIIQDAGYGDRFGHGLGHGLGVEVHEGPRLNTESDVVLEPGMVVTVEPGIYLPGQGGVRIEDVVVVTPDGCENLATAPKELKVLSL